MGGVQAEKVGEAALLVVMVGGGGGGVELMRNQIRLPKETEESSSGLWGQSNLGLCLVNVPYF